MKTACKDVHRNLQAMTLKNTDNFKCRSSLKFKKSLYSSCYLIIR